MKIYVSHKRLSNFEEELYEPLKRSDLAKNNEFIFPHDNNSNSFNSKELFQNKKCDLALAEVSNPATGQGIELAWANASGIPIICVYKNGSDISGSLKFLTDKFIEYETIEDLTSKLTIVLNQNIA